MADVAKDIQTKLDKVQAILEDDELKDAEKLDVIVDVVAEEEA